MSINGSPSIISFGNDSSPTQQPKNSKLPSQPPNIQPPQQPWIPPTQNNTLNNPSQINTHWENTDQSSFHAENDHDPELGAGNTLISPQSNNSEFDYYNYALKEKQNLSLPVHKEDIFTMGDYNPPPGPLSAASTNASATISNYALRGRRKSHYDASLQSQNIDFQHRKSIDSSISNIYSSKGNLQPPTIVESHFERILDDYKNNSSENMNINPTETNQYYNNPQTSNNMAFDVESAAGIEEGAFQQTLSYSEPSAKQNNINVLDNESQNYEDSDARNQYYQSNNSDHDYSFSSQVQPSIYQQQQSDHANDVSIVSSISPLPPNIENNLTIISTSTPSNSGTASIPFIPSQMKLPTAQIRSKPAIFQPSILNFKKPSDDSNSRNNKGGNAQMDYPLQASQSPVNFNEKSPNIQNNAPSSAQTTNPTTPTFYQTNLQSLIPPPTRTQRRPSNPKSPSSLFDPRSSSPNSGAIEIQYGGFNNSNTMNATSPTGNQTYQQPIIPPTTEKTRRPSNSKSPILIVRRSSSANNFKHDKQPFDTRYPANFKNYKNSAIATGGCSLSESEITTAASFIYDWPIHNFNQLQSSEEKIVSPPFGVRDLLYQLVVYPKGVGDACNSHISIFLRPIKNEVESSKEEDWFRPINNFGAHIISPYEDPNSINYFYMSEMTGADFQGFSNLNPGWGFTHFLDLQDLQSAVSQEGTVNFQCEINWPQTEILTSISKSIEIPINFESEFCSELFGTHNESWRVKFSRHFENGDSKIGVFLSRSEAMGLSKIASLNVKIFNGSEMIISKTLTGGFTFSKNNVDCGWPSLFSKSNFDKNNIYTAMINFDFIAESPGSEIEMLNKIEGLELKNSNIEKSVTGLQTSLEKKSEEIEKLSSTVKSYRTELENKRFSNEENLSLKKSISEAKYRLSNILNRIESNKILPDEFHDENKKDNMYDISSYQKRVAELEIEVYNLRLEVSHQENLIFEFKVHDLDQENDSIPEEPLSVEECITKVQEEIQESKTALEEALFKVGFAEISVGEKVGICADLIIRLAELDVSRAALYASISLNSDSIVSVNHIKEELLEIRGKLLSAITKIDPDGNSILLDNNQMEAGLKRNISPFNLDNAEISPSEYEEKYLTQLPDVKSNENNILSEESKVLKAEPWTPEPERVFGSEHNNDSKYDVKSMNASELRSLLSKLEKNQRTASRKTSVFIALLLFLATFIFSLYSAAHIICLTDLKSKSKPHIWMNSSYREPFCRKIVTPTWDIINYSWNITADVIETNIIPGVYDFTLFSKKRFIQFGKLLYIQTMKSITNFQIEPSEMKSIELKSPETSSNTADIIKPLKKKSENHNIKPDESENNISSDSVSTVISGTLPSNSNQPPTPNEKIKKNGRRYNQNIKPDVPIKEFIHTKKSLSKTIESSRIVQVSNTPNASVSVASSKPNETLNTEPALNTPIASISEDIIKSNETPAIPGKVNNEPALNSVSEDIMKPYETPVMSEIFSIESKISKTPIASVSEASIKPDETPVMSEIFSIESKISKTPIASVSEASIKPDETPVMSEIFSIESKISKTPIASVSEASIKPDETPVMSEIFSIESKVSKTPIASVSEASIKPDETPVMSEIFSIESKISKTPIASVSEASIKPDETPVISEIFSIESKVSNIPIASVSEASIKPFESTDSKTSNSSISNGSMPDSMPYVDLKLVDDYKLRNDSIEDSSIEVIEESAHKLIDDFQTEEADLPISVDNSDIEGEEESSTDTTSDSMDTDSKNSMTEHIDL